MKKKLSIRRLRLLLLAGPSAIFLLVYVFLSMLFVNTTDKHLLTGHREPDDHAASLYHRVVNELHQKMLFTPDTPASPKTAKTNHTAKKTSLKKTSL